MEIENTQETDTGTCLDSSISQKELTKKKKNNTNRILLTYLSI